MRDGVAWYLRGRTRRSWYAFEVCPFFRSLIHSFLHCVAVSRCCVSCLLSTLFIILDQLADQRRILFKFCPIKRETSSRNPMVMRVSQSASAATVPNDVIAKLLGRGLSHKQWSLILTGELFNDCFGGRYYTEWQHALCCHSFVFDKAIKQKLVECEMEMFRDEIMDMLEQGYALKSIVRRLRGEIWRSDERGEVWSSDEKDEKVQRLWTQRLLGMDTRFLNLY